VPPSSPLFLLYLSIFVPLEGMVHIPGSWAPRPCGASPGRGRGEGPQGAAISLDDDVGQVRGVVSIFLPSGPHRESSPPV